MLAKVTSGATVGLDSVPVTVEVDISSQSLPSFTIVGLPDKAVEESKERVRSAIKNSGASFPAKRIIINLAPADLPKEGPKYDLPIAIGILLAAEQLQADVSENLFMGELSLDGSLRHTNGVLPLTILAKEKKLKNIFVPSINAKEASVIKGIKVLPVKSLTCLFRHLSKTEELTSLKHRPFSSFRKERFYEFDMTDIKGQEHAKRACEIAAAGNHNLFMKGLPGAGKTMLARTIPSILPDLTEEEALEATKIYSITGNLPAGKSILTHRPFRCPHHTTSRVGLIGGGSKPMPGEISLAHRGVLFLDEFPEFPRHVLEAIRQPMEDGIVTISRAKGTISYPAKFLLVGAANPCPCGHFGDLKKNCKCLPGQINRYQKRVSGPILDRIDLHVNVPQVDVEKLTKDDLSKIENSESIQKRVQKSRNMQLERFKNTKIKSNGDMSTKDVKRFCTLSNECKLLLRQAAAKMGLSARGYYKIIKISRTIADLENAKDISESHIAESLQYRPKNIE